MAGEFMRHYVPGYKPPSTALGDALDAIARNRMQQRQIDAMEQQGRAQIASSQQIAVDKAGALSAENEAKRAHDLARDRTAWQNKQLEDVGTATQSTDPSALLALQARQGSPLNQGFLDIQRKPMPPMQTPEQIAGPQPGPVQPFEGMESQMTDRADYERKLAEGLARQKQTRAELEARGQPFVIKTGEQTKEWHPSDVLGPRGELLKRGKETFGEGYVRGDTPDETFTNAYRAMMDTLGPSNPATASIDAMREAAKARQAHQTALNAEESAKGRGRGLSLRGAGEDRRQLEIERKDIAAFDRSNNITGINGKKEKIRSFNDAIESIDGNGIESGATRNMILRMYEKGVATDKDFKRAVGDKAGMWGSIESWIQGKLTGDLGDAEKAVMKEALVKMGVRVKRDMNNLRREYHKLRKLAPADPTTQNAYDRGETRLFGSIESGDEDSGGQSDEDFLKDNQ